MPDTGRPPDVSTLTHSELERTRRDLTAALALARPGSPTRLPIGTYLATIDAELASRASQHHQAPVAAHGRDTIRMRPAYSGT